MEINVDNGKGESIMRTNNYIKVNNVPIVHVEIKSLRKKASSNLIWVGGKARH